jgi:hypothetical protein
MNKLRAGLEFFNFSLPLEKVKRELNITKHKTKDLCFRLGVFVGRGNFISQPAQMPLR